MSDRINHYLKLLGLRLLAATLRGLVLVKTRLPGVFKIGQILFGWLAKPLTQLAILPLYKLYLTNKKLFTRFYAPQFTRHRLVHPFSRRYLVHLVIIVIAVLTVAANLNAYEIRPETFGQGSIVAQLVTTEDLGTIAEEGPITDAKKITRYLGQTGVESKPQVTASAEQEAPPSTAVGGSAVISQILSPIEEALRQRDKIVYYPVEPGDTISEIAEKFGISSNTILWENNLSAYRIIRPGDQLAILPSSGIRHKVVSGDTIEKIAKKYNVNGSTIIEANKLASADDIQIGEQLFIPGGAQPYVAPPTYTVRSLTQIESTLRPPAQVVTTDDLLWPSSCRRITQYFRWLHTGVDVACGYGKPVYAADSGTVIRADGGWNGGYGLLIEINHGNGIATLYGHLSNIYVKVGETVEKGEVIAAEGSTGRSTGPHLHFEIRVGSERKNPLYYVN